MSTESSNIEIASGIAGELTEVIKTNSVAYQACGVQISTSRAPLVFGIKKGSTKSSFEIVSKTPTKVYDTGTTPSTDNFTEELIDDVFHIFGKDAVEILKTIAGNNLADDLDAVVLDYMYSISNKKSDVTYDFTTDDHSSLIHELILKINKERMTIAKSLKRGLPKMLIVSPGVAALLITNKMISGNDTDYIAGEKENTKFVGKMGDMQVFMFDQSDLSSVSSEYVIIAHKSYIPGDASMILIPIQAPKSAIRHGKETGQLNLHFTQKYAYSANPLDRLDSSLSIADTIFLDSDNSINSVLTDFTTLVNPGDTIEVSDSASNNGTYVVTSVTADKIIVEGAGIVDEGIGTTITPTDAIFTNSDNSINSVLTDLSVTFSPGDSFEVQDTVSNNGVYVVETVTANKIVVTAASGTITDEGTGSATLIKDNSGSSTLDKNTSDFISSFNLTLTGFTV